MLTVASNDSDIVCAQININDVVSWIIPLAWSMDLTSRVSGMSIYHGQGMYSPPSHV